MFDAKCPFCRIVQGQEPASVVHSDAQTLSFLDRRPLFEGHVLLVPRPHVPTLTDLEAADVGPLFLRAQALARAVGSALDAPGTFVAMNNVISQSVPHLHVHVVPRRPKDGLRGFFWPRTTYADDDARDAVAARIAAAYVAP